MIKMTSNELQLLLNASLIGDENIQFHGISIDTRTLLPNNLFVAIKGEQFDGHDFVQEAYTKGATLALVEKQIESPIPQLIVSDTTLALGKMAAHWRNHFSLPLIAITGSNGKTTVKNMVRAILLAHCDNDENKVLSTKGNLNNHWGMPLTLAKISNEHRYAVIEMGMNHFGEIAYLSKIAQPTIAVITHAGAAHLEGVNDLAGVAKAKAEIFEGLTKDGVAILNRDDNFYAYWREKTASFHQISFGLNPEADISASIQIKDGLQHLIVKTPSETGEIQLSLLGEHNAKNALAAIAVAFQLKISLATVASGLSTLKPEKGRLNVSLLPTGTRLIDDTYNANPTSFEAAIETLTHFNHHTILVMGDMKELGQEANLWHEIIGKNAKSAGITHLYTIGELSKHASNAFGNEAYHFTDYETLCSTLKEKCLQETTVLVKGSRSMKMEKVVQYLLSD